MKRKIAVLGDGGWGTTVAILLCNKGYDVLLWGAFPEYIKDLEKKRVNEKFLPGMRIPDKIKITSSPEDLKSAETTIVAIPSKYLRNTITALKGKLSDRIVSLTKGIEEKTFKRPSEIIADVTGAKAKIAVLSGPSISFEVARNFPTTCVAASSDETFVKDVQDILTTPTFRVYTSGDVIGVELGGALKNIIAIAAGISDGMGFGVNTKAALLTRGLVEIIRLGTKLGGKKETFFGLSGLGDLATTCMSTHSRNRWLGEEIGKGKRLEQILKTTEMIMEGVTTTSSAYNLSKKVNVEMPITGNIYQVLYEGKEPKGAVKELMTRALKPEAI